MPKVSDKKQKAGKKPRKYSVSNAEWSGDTRDAIRYAATAVAVLAVLVFGVVQISRWASPEMESIRRDTYVESASYQQGTVRNLRDLIAEYHGAESEAHRRGLAASILDRAGSFEHELPEDIATFVAELGESK